jgi:hypothetical protein
MDLDRASAPPKGGRTATSDKFELIQQEWTVAGLDLLQPYLNFLPLDCYNFAF